MMQRTITKPAKLKFINIIGRQEDEASYSAAYTAVYKKQGKASTKALVQYYDNEMAQRCHCTRDCCGHWFSGLAGIKRKGNKIYFKLAFARNY